MRACVRACVRVCVGVCVCVYANRFMDKIVNVNICNITKFLIKLYRSLGIIYIV